MPKQLSDAGADLVDNLVDLVLPRRCVGCGSPLGTLCGRCVPARVLEVALGPLDVVAAAAYSDEVRRALILYKERGRRDLTTPLSRLLARAVAGVLAAGRASPRSVALVPIPSSRAAAAARGGDHVARLARRAARTSGVRLAPGVLAHTRSVSDSAGLSVEAREANMAGALRARHGGDGRAAVLVDDIVTTGATLREAARALTDAGWPVLGAAVVAATERRAQRVIGRPGQAVYRQGDLTGEA